MQADPLEGVSAALAALPGVTPEACDGRGHTVEGAAACVHLRIGLASPAREEFLGRLAPLVRRAQFVLVALIDRRDLYGLSHRPGPRGASLPEAAAGLESLLRDAREMDSGVVPDRRGR